MKMWIRYGGMGIALIGLLWWAGPSSVAHGHGKKGHSKKEEKKPAKKKDVILIGEIVDLTCYLSHGDTGKGPDHKQCGVTCVEKGLPVGLLEDKTDKVYLIATKEHEAANKILAKHVADKVKIHGRIKEGKGVTLFIMTKFEKIKTAK